MANATTIAEAPKGAAEMLPLINGKLPGAKARAIIDRDNTVMSASYTRDYPFVMDRGEGCVVWDVDGNRFLDMAAGIAVCATGHAHPHVVDAITNQAKKFLHMSGTDFYYEVQIRLAERLFKYSPIKGNKRVFFTNSGAESIEGAIKLARHATGGHQMISFFGAFHGRTMGALSLTASKNVQRKNFSPFLPGVQHARYGEDLSYIEDYILGKTADMGNFAAIFVEAIQGEGGYIVPKVEWLLGLRELCTRHKILLVVDEVQSGMGRTGKMFACEHFGLEPDIMTFAKGIASGLPLGGFMAKAEVMDWGPGQHGTTFGGNPVACAAANATLDLLEQGMMANATEVGDYMKGRLAELEGKVPHVKGARGLGLMLAVDVVDDKGEFSPALRNDIIDEFFKHGILALGCGAHSIRFCPPLCLTKEQADFTVDTLATIAKALPAKANHPPTHEDGVAS
jgi:4-aminobutyrate aminotransferase